MYKFATSMLIISLMFAGVYYMLADQFQGIVTFTDAIYYSLCLSTTTGNNRKKPLTHIAKLLASLQLIITFSSLFNFQILKNSTFIFTFFNLLIIGLFTGIQMYVFNLEYADAIYNATSTHTFTSHPHVTANQYEKLITIIHMIIVFTMLFNIQNSGFYNIVKSLIFGATPPVDPFVYG